jgi:hypothetical protein
MTSVGRRFVLTALAFPQWLFGPRAAGLDLGPGVIAAGWCALMICKPEVFDRGSFIGMAWLPDLAWTLIMAVMALGHAAGLLLPFLRSVRCAASLLSAWMWLVISVSLWRVEFSTGVWVYGVIGFGALFGAIYLAGLPHERR